MAREHEVSDGDVHAMASWPGLAEARVVAAERGASTVGTEHVLLSLLWGPEDEATRALRGAGLDYHAIAVALDAVVGPGGRRPISREPVVPRVSSRVEQLLRDARHRAQGTGDAGGDLSDHDVLAALLDSDEQCVANLVMNYVGVRRRALDGLHHTSTTSAATGAA